MKLEDFLERLLDGLQRITNKAEQKAKDYLEAFLKFLEDAKNWLEKAYNAAVRYLKRLLPLLGHLSLALSKIGLLFVPAAICIVVGLITGLWIWHVAGVAWGSLMAAILFAYSHTKKESGEDSEPPVPEEVPLVPEEEEELAAPPELPNKSE